MNDGHNITINTARSIIFADEFEDSERLTSKRSLKESEAKVVREIN
jgi:hypothetical protein